MGDTTVGPAGRRDREGAIRAGLARAGRKLHDMPYRFTREDTVSKTRFINPQGLSKPPGYTHVVEATAPARLVYIAGQLGMDRDGKLSSDFRLQAVQTFENLKTALAAVGATFQHVVKLNNYLVNLTHLPIFRQVRDSYLADDNRPASTTLAISGLAREGAMLEVDNRGAAAGARAQEGGGCRALRYQSGQTKTTVVSASTGSITRPDHSM